MSDNHRFDPDPLGHATAALRNTPVPPGPPEPLIAATLAAISVRTFPPRRRWLMRILGLGSLATAAAVLVALFASPARSPAEDVKKAVLNAEKAKTVRLLVEQDDGAGTKLTTRIYLSDGKRRTDTEPVGLSVILNEKTQKGVMLFAKQQAYRTIDLGTDDPLNRAAKKGYEANSVCAAFKNLPKNHTAAVTDEYLDGRKTKAYELTDLKFDEGGDEFKDGKADMKLWVNPKTDFPVQARTVLKAGEKKVTSVYTYLGFDEDLDPKLFDTAIPDGYKKLDLPKADK